MYQKMKCEPTITVILEKVIKANRSIQALKELLQANDMEAVKFIIENELDYVSSER